MPGNTESPRTGPPGFTRILQRRKVLLLLTWAVTLVLGAAAAFWAPDTVSSYVTLLFERPPVAHEAAAPSAKSQIEIMRQHVENEDFLRRVIARSEILLDPETRNWAARASNGRTSDQRIEAYLVDHLRRSIAIEPRPGSTFRVRVDDSRPDRARRLADAVGAQFVESARAAQLDAVRTAQELSLEQHRLFKRRLEESERRLEAFRNGSSEGSAYSRITQADVIRARTLLEQTELDLEQRRRRVADLRARLVSAAGGRGVAALERRDPLADGTAQGARAAARTPPCSPTIPPETEEPWRGRPCRGSCRSSRCSSFTPRPSRFAPPRRSCATGSYATGWSRRSSRRPRRDVPISASRSASTSVSARCPPIPRPSSAGSPRTSRAIARSTTPTSRKWRRPGSPSRSRVPSSPGASRCWDRRACRVCRSYPDASPSSGSRSCSAGSSASAAAWLAERRDPSVRNTYEVESLLGLPVLGAVPRVEDLERRRRRAARGRASLRPAASPGCFSASRRRVPLGIEFRRIYLRLAQDRRAVPGTLLVTSSTRGEGKTLTAACLAITLARELREEVLLVDFDLRSPALHRALGSAGQQLGTFADPPAAEVRRPFRALDGGCRARLPAGGPLRAPGRRAD